MKFIKWFFIVLVIVILACAIYFIVSVSKFRSGDVKDLGVRYTYKDYTEAVANKAKVSVKDPAALYLGSVFSTEGSVYVDQEFSNAEISAIQNFSNNDRGPFKDVQIAFHEDGIIEASGMVTDERVNGPVYVKGKINKTGPKSFEVDTIKIVAGQYSAPSPLRKIIDQKFSAYVNGLLNDINNLNIENVEIKEGSVRFLGNLPAKIY